MKKILTYTVVGVALMTACKSNISNEVVPVVQSGEFILVQTQKIDYSNGHSMQVPEEIYYQDDCDEKVVFFLTSDSIGVSVNSGCGNEDLSSLRWAYEAISLDEVSNPTIKEKYSQIEELNEVIHYYSPVELQDQYNGYYGLIHDNNYDLVLVNDNVILYFKYF